MDPPVAGFIVGFVKLLVIEPPQLTLLHAHLFTAAHEHAARGALQHQMETIAEEIIRSFVDVAKDLRLGFETHDGGARKMTVHLLCELVHEGQSSRE